MGILQEDYSLGSWRLLPNLKGMPFLKITPEVLSDVADSVKLVKSTSVSLDWSDNVFGKILEAKDN